MNRFAEIKQYKHKMLQYFFFFFFYFPGIYMSSETKGGQKKFTEIEEITVANHKP